MPAPKRKNQQEAPPPKPGFKIKLRPVEMLALGLLGMAILLYGINRCNRSDQPLAQNPNASSLVNPADSSTAQLSDSLKAALAGLPKVYVVMDSVKLRSKPALDGNIVKVLMHDEIVYDLGEQTQKMENIRFSAEESRTEPWVKVRTAEGATGWVFGAVVSFYRKRKPSRPARDSSISLDSLAPSTTPAAPATTPTSSTPIPSRPTAPVSRPNTNR